MLDKSGAFNFTIQTTSAGYFKALKMFLENYRSGILFSRIFTINNSQLLRNADNLICITMPCLESRCLKKKNLFSLFNLTVQFKFR